MHCSCLCSYQSSHSNATTGLWGRLLFRRKHVSECPWTSSNPRSPPPNMSRRCNILAVVVFNLHDPVKVHVKDVTKELESIYASLATYISQEAFQVAMGVNMWHSAEDGTTFLTAWIYCFSLVSLDHICGPIAPIFPSYLDELAYIYSSCVFPPPPPSMSLTQLTSGII